MESAPVPPVVVHVPAIPKPNQAKKKVSIQEDNRRSGTEVSCDAHCLIITGNNIGRFLPPRHVSSEKKIERHKLILIYSYIPRC
ncbi:uncharacterized protein CEXT_446371 [Caerostris extrusa]|uniref:Uncharacterized protein n=1 Tax=Caerostris extrusa TaxID=172846 RepID=A0AAV4S909_CAEEX|nr:uncharacterized protein CEXT_446371 [Caerostris extrusa]